MTDERKCFFCDATEDDSNLTSCHNCDRTICVDNCVASTNDEHGVDFCEECTEAERLRPTWMVLRPSGDEYDEDGRSSYTVMHRDDVADELDLQRRVHAGPVDWYRASSIVESAAEFAAITDGAQSP